MSIPQVNASAISNQLESHISLLGVHVDFSLIKVQPPSEYQELGKSLSLQRNEEAETGESHATASKLGVLFDGVVPDAPDLIRAYGLRCSEIAKSPTFNPKGTHKHGLFADQVGADGTTIWAAATSGPSSIAVHLLACMLARIWDSPKAISIWMELIATRKESLATSGKPLDYHAARISFTRNEIAKWDASARAWRMTADQANERRQKQLLLIVDHVGLPVSGKMDLSESVIEAWRTAMVTVDKLVAGEPQSVQIGAPLLGLAAWHLYPDMVIPGKVSDGRPVKQKDQLIRRGGVLTLGLEDARRSGEGIYWSLPLAHLRYYGDPVQSEARLSTQTSRVSIDQLQYIAMGSLIRRWCADADQIELAARLLVALDKFLAGVALVDSRPWLQLLAAASKGLLDSRGDRRDEILQLVKCGRRRFPAFIDNISVNSIFGLSDPKTLLQLTNNTEARIEILRHVAKDLGKDRRLMVIQCHTDQPNSPWELASVEALQTEPLSQTVKYYRWLNSDHTDGPLDNPEMYKIRRDAKTVRFESWQPIPQFRSYLGYNWNAAPESFYSAFCEVLSPGGRWMHARGFTTGVRFLFGDPLVAAIYAISITHWTKGQNEDPETIENKCLEPLPNIFVLSHVLASIERNLLFGALLYAHFDKSSQTSDGENEQWGLAVIKPLRALVTLHNLYRNLPNATIELKVAARPLSGHRWASQLQQFLRPNPWAPLPMTLEQTFACIARFESGTFNFEPSAMNGVFAIASGNSLFVSRCLLQDPCERSSTALVERVVGNVGRSGMAMLVLPQVPKIRDLSHDYTLVNHHKFDGNEEDSFGHTTLHMSFTDWKMALDVGSRGNRDVEAYYIEAPIGVYDHGKWVADINILNVFQHKMSRMVPRCRQRHEDYTAKERLSKFVTIDNWEELLDHPQEVGVVRARSNWQARLAAAALAIQRGHEVRIIPSEVCWICCTTLEPVTNSEKEDEIDQEEDDDVITVPDKPLDESGSDSELDEEMEALRSRRPSKRMKLDPGSPMDTTPIGRTEDRNLIYIF